MLQPRCDHCEEPTPRMRKPALVTHPRIESNGRTRTFRVSVESLVGARSGSTDLCPRCQAAVLRVAAHLVEREARGEAPPAPPAVWPKPDMITIDLDLKPGDSMRIAGLDFGKGPDRSVVHGSVMDRPR